METNNHNNFIQTTMNSSFSDYFQKFQESFQVLYFILKRMRECINIIFFK